MIGVLDRDLLKDTLGNLGTASLTSGASKLKYARQLFDPSLLQHPYFLSDPVLANFVYAEDDNSPLHLKDGIAESLNRFLDENLAEVELFAEETVFFILSVKTVPERFLEDDASARQMIYSFHFFLVVNLCYIWNAFELSVYTMSVDFTRLEAEQRLLINAGVSLIGGEGETVMSEAVKTFFNAVMSVSSTLTSMLTTSRSSTFKQAEQADLVARYGEHAGPLKFDELGSLFEDQLRRSLLPIITMPTNILDEALRAPPLGVTPSGAQLTPDMQNLVNQLERNLIRHDFSGDLGLEVAENVRAGLQNTAIEFVLNFQSRLSGFRILSNLGVRESFINTQLILNSQYYNLLENMHEVQSALSLVEETDFERDIFRMDEAFASAVLTGVAGLWFGPTHLLVGMMLTSTIDLLTQNEYVQVNRAPVQTARQRDYTSAIYLSLKRTIGIGEASPISESPGVSGIARELIVDPILGAADAVGNVVVAVGKGIGYGLGGLLTTALVVGVAVVGVKAFASATGESIGESIAPSRKRRKKNK